MAGPQKRKAGFPPKGGADVTRRHPAMAVALNKHRRCRRACGCSYQPTKRSFEQTIELRPGTRKSNPFRSEEHTSELQSLMRISYAVFCLKKKNRHTQTTILQEPQTKQQTRK